MENGCLKGNVDIIKLIVKKYKLPITISHLDTFFKKDLLRFQKIY